MADDVKNLSEPLIAEGDDVFGEGHLGQVNLEEVRESIKEGGSFVVNMGQQVGASVYEGSKVAAASLVEVLHSDQLAAAGGVVFDNVSELYSQTSEAAGELLSMISGVSTSLLDWVKIDIFRDFFQIVGLFFGGINWPSSFKTIGSFAATTAIDIRVWVTALSPLVFFWVNTLTASICFIIFLVVSGRGDPNALEDGLEVQNWQARSKYARKIQQYLLWIAITLYLPVSRNAIRIFTCTPIYAAEFADGCFKRGYWFYVFLAVLTTGLISIAMPIRCYQLIQFNKPKEVSFDSEGKQVEYTDEHFRQDVEKDKSPYVFLYKGYERKWAFYKVIVMAVKMVLVVVVVFFSENEIFHTRTKLSKILQAGSIFVVLFAYAVLSWKTAPFIKRSADLMDMGARVTNALVAVAAIVIAISTKLGSSLTIGWVLNGVMLFNTAFMMVCFLWGSGPVRRVVKKLTKTLEFTMAGSVPLVFSPELNFARERKLRIWHPFFEGLFLKDEPFAPPKEQVWSYSNTEGTAPYLLGFKGTPGERFIELKEIMGDIGFAAYEKALLPVPDEVYRDRLYAQNSLEGVDVYWDGIPADGHLDSVTCFGKCFIIPFPFKCVMIYDDGKDHTFIADEKFLEFVAKNREQEIVRRRSVRHSLRACVHAAANLYYYHQQHISKSYTVQVRDSQGNSRSETRSESVLFTFTHGRLHIDRNRKDAMSAGFDVSFTLNDGTGRGPKTGTQYTGEQLACDAEFIGITDDFEMTAKLNRLLNGHGNESLWKPSLAPLLQQFQDYRDKLVHERMLKQMTLSYEFYYSVYNNDSLTREQLSLYFEQREKQKSVRALPNRHRAGLDYLYEKLAYYNSHACRAYFFVFWDDVFCKNSEVFQGMLPKELREKPPTQPKGRDTAWALLHPANPRSLMYNLMDREQLLKLLEAVKLRKGKKGYLNGKLLDNLYYNLDRVARGETPANQQT